MINFTNCEINKYKMYGGQNENKICIKYNGEDYMLKFPSNKKDINNILIVVYQNIYHVK